MCRFLSLLLATTFGLPTHRSQTSGPPMFRPIDAFGNVDNRLGKKSKIVLLIF